MRDLSALIASNQVIVCCGSGGVGKTTVAATVGAMAASELGLKVLVLTIDPARRLATALGLDEFGNKEARVPDALFEQAGLSSRGEMWAAMLDTKDGWDEIVRQHAPDAETRDKIYANGIYQGISERFVQSHDYVAMERLYQLHSSGNYDLVVVDTPPTRNAIDFLEAPERMADFFSSKTLRWLTAPARSRMLNLASRPFYTVADKVLGSQFLSDIADFFLLFQSMYDGFVDRSSRVSELLSSPATSFVVVSSLEVAPSTESAFFIEELGKRDLSLGAIVINRVLPPWLNSVEYSEYAKKVLDSPGQFVGDLEETSGKGTDKTSAIEIDSEMLATLAQNFLNWAIVAKREAQQANRLKKLADTVLAVPALDGEITDLEGISRIGAYLLGPGVGAASDVGI